MASRLRGPLTVGAGGVLFRRGDVLLVHLTYGPSQGRWTIPGGFQEPGETLWETAGREVLEETGVKGRAVRLVAVRSLTLEDQSDSYFAFAMEDLGGEPKADGKEAAEAAFRPLVWAAGSPEVASLSRALLAGAAGPRGMVALADVSAPPHPGVKKYILYGTLPPPRS